MGERVKKYFCNPINVNYRYQFNQDPRVNKLQINREAADPSMILFQDRYYIFASMNLSVWVSDDLVNWESHRLPEQLPLYDYAPDVRVNGEYVYFSASKKGSICDFYRTKDIINGPYEEIKGTFEFWDPNLYFEDGKVFFYWGCTNTDPLWGVELDSVTLKPIGEKVALIDSNSFSRGYERVGVDNREFPRNEVEVEYAFEQYLKTTNNKIEDLPAMYIPLIKGMFSNRPFIEGPWVEKYNGKYYLQYATPGTQYNIYADGVYISDYPLGPYELAKNNPYSYMPGGFMPGAGHGSTMWDRNGNFWHASTMSISVNHQFERRVGIWPSGFDQDDELFCNQNFGTWPIAVKNGKIDAWSEPEWFLLSYGKKVQVSSSIENKSGENAVDEDVKTCWKASTNASGEWIEIDLGNVQDTRGIQINFADDEIDIEVPGKIQGMQTQPRYIEERDFVTRWKLEGSVDGKEYFILKDKSHVNTDLSHDFVVIEEGIRVRYVKLTILEIPYQLNPAISGLRVFGIGNGQVPEVPKYKVRRSEDSLNFVVDIDNTEKTIGYNILWGHEKEKLYHSYQVYVDVNSLQHNNTKFTKNIGALVKEQKYFIRVDSFNENGIVKGNVVELE